MHAEIDKGTQGRYKCQEFPSGSLGGEREMIEAVQLGTLDLWQIAMKPGKPFAFGSIKRETPSEAADPSCYFMGLPGNPVSSFVTFLLLVRPFLLKLQGAPVPALRPAMLPAHFELARADKRREFVRVRRNEQGGLDLFPNQSSGVLTSAVWGDGLVDNPAGHTVARGDLVPYLAFSELLE